MTKAIRLTRGFSLIELMIALAVLALLAGMAYPSYTGQVRESRRSEAIAHILAIQQAEEKWRTSNATYGTLAQVGAAGSNSHYNFAVAGNTATTYTVTATATAVGGQNQDSERSTSCGTLTLSVNGPAETRTPGICW